LLIRGGESEKKETTEETRPGTIELKNMLSRRTGAGGIRGKEKDGGNNTFKKGERKPHEATIKKSTE